MDPVALITGSARRIGAEITRTLHQRGMRVIIHYRNSDAEATALADQRLWYVIGISFKGHGYPGDLATVL